MMAMSTHSRAWIAVGIVIVAIMLWIGYDNAKGWLLHRAGEKQSRENVEVLKQGTETKAEMVQLKGQRDAALALAAKEAIEKRRLLTKVDVIEKQRAALKAPATAQEAARALKAMGY